MRILALLLVLFGPLALWSADWYSVRLLANPIVQPVELPVAGEEGAVPVLVKTSEGVARAFATNAGPSGSVPLGSLASIHRLDIERFGVCPQPLVRWFGS